MTNYLTFNKTYFGLSFILFLIEVLIALFINDSFIRPYLGDVLVVILIYCFIKSFFKLQVINLAVFVLFFAFTIEFLQYLNIVEKLNLENNKIAKTVLGTSFAWLDLVCYLIGIAIILLIEKYCSSTKKIR